MSKKNAKDWREIIKTTRNTNLEEIVRLYLKDYFKTERANDLDMPCYICKDYLELVNY